MARFDAISEINFFDDDYFLYFEEVDLMHRLKRRNWKVWHFPEAIVTHVGGASTGVSSENPLKPALPDYWFNSWRCYFEKLHGRGRAKWIALVRYIGTLLGDLYCSIRGVPLRNPKGFSSDFRRIVLKPLFFPGNADQNE